MKKTKKLALLAIGAALAACQPDTKNLEKKIDDLSKSQQKMMELLAKGGGPGAAQQQRPPQQRQEPDRAKTYAVPVDGDGFDGPADAKVTLVKAYDYACPYCEKVRTTMNDLRQKYGNDLRIVYKQMVVHPQMAMAGALAYCAANKQGKGHQMDELLWEKGFKARVFDQTQAQPPAPMAEAGGAPGKAADPNAKCWDTPSGCTNVVAWAQEAQLDVAKFKADMKGDCQQAVQKDMGELQRLGVAATPSFFINGRFISGAMPIDNFTTLIDEELKKANERGGGPGYYNQWVMQKGQKSLTGP
jgi:protein-disulfide isomerase